MLFLNLDSFFSLVQTEKIAVQLSLDLFVFIKFERVSNFFSLALLARDLIKPSVLIQWA